MMDRSELPAWPWPDPPEEGSRLDWSVRLQTDPDGAWCDVRYVVLTPDQLIFLVDVETPDQIDCVDEARAPGPKQPGDPRFWITMGGLEIESTGEWDGSDPERLRELQHPDFSLHDLVGHLGDQASTVILSPVPSGRIQLSVQWLDRGLDRCSVHFDVPTVPGDS